MSASAAACAAPIRIRCCSAACACSTISIWRCAAPRAAVLSFVRGRDDAPWSRPHAHHARGASGPRRRHAWSANSRMASSASSKSAWRWPARRASSCSTSRRRGCRRASAANWCRSSALPVAYRLRHHRARPRCGAARGRERHRHAQRPHLQGGHARRRSRATPKCSASIWEASMAEPAPSASPALRCAACTVHYGRVEALHDLSLTLERGVLADRRPQRHGQDHALQDVMGLDPPRARGRSRSTAPRYRALATARDRAMHGVAYVPQGRRVWPSLTVDEHLRLAFIGDTDTAWTVERVYTDLPAARRAQRTATAPSCPAASSRCWRSAAHCWPIRRLLIMDEPTEGLAPIIVEQVSAMLKRLAEEGEIVDPADRAESRRRAGRSPDTSRSWSMDASPARCPRANWPPIPRCNSACSASAATRTRSRREDAPEPVAEVRVHPDPARMHGEDSAASHTFGHGAPPAYSATAIPNRWSADNPSPRQQPSPRRASSARRAAAPEVSACRSRR